MSMRTYIVHGYGINVDDLTVTNTAEGKNGMTEEEFRAMLEKCPDTKKGVLAWFNDVSESIYSESDADKVITSEEEKILDAVMTDYEDDYCETGLGPILKKCLTEYSGMEFFCMTDDYGNQFVFLEARMPWQYTDKERAATAESLAKIFSDVTGRDLVLDNIEVELFG